MEYHEMLQRFVGRRVCVSTFGHLKLWGKLTAVTDDCLRLVNTSVSGEGEDQWLSQHQYDDEEGSTAGRHAETLVHFHHVVAISCLDDDLPAVNFELPVAGAANSKLENKASQALAEPPNTRTWETVDQHPKEDEERDAYEGLSVERMELQIGARLIPLVDPKRGGDLRERITFLRNLVGNQFGFILPVIRIRDHLQLEPEEYRILIHGAEISRGRLEPDRLLALQSPQVTEPLPGETIREPAYSQPALWIESSQRSLAQKSGYFTVEPNTVLVTHLQKVVRTHPRELFSLDSLRHHLELVRRTAPTTVEEVVPQRVTLPRLHDLLGRLLEEEVSIRPLEFILEHVSHLDTANMEVEDLLISVRIGLGRLICEKYRNREGTLPVFALDRAVHDHLSTLLTNEPTEEAGYWISQFVARFREWYFNMREQEGCDVPLVVDTLVRRKVWQLLHQSIPGIVVLAFSEIAHDVSVDLLHNLSHKTLGLKTSYAPVAKSTRRMTVPKNTVPKNMAPKHAPSANEESKTSTTKRTSKPR
jgi:flagellar biosynthesis component FlhA